MFCSLIVIFVIIQKKIDVKCKNNLKQCGIHGFLNSSHIFLAIKILKYFT